MKSKLRNWLRDKFGWLNRKRRFALGAYLALTFSFALLLTPVKASLQEEGGPNRVAWVMAISSSVSLLGYKYSGSRGDRWGKLLMSIIALPLFAVSLGLLYLHRLEVTWVVSVLIYAIAFVAVDSLFQSTLTESNRLNAVGVEIALAFLGAGVATTLGARLIDASYSLWVSSCIVTVAVSWGMVLAVSPTVARISVKRAYASIRRRKKKERNRVKRPAVLPNIRGWRKNFDSGLMKIALPQLVISMVQVVFMTYTIADLGDDIASLVISASMILNGLSAPFMSKVIEKKGDNFIYFLSLCFLISSMLLIWLGRDVVSLWGVPLLLLLAGALTGIALCCSRLSFKTQVYESAPQDKKGAATALISSIPHTGMLIGTLGGALIIYTFGQVMLWPMMIIPLLLMIALLFWEKARAWRKRQRLDKLFDEAEARVDKLEAEVRACERTHRLRSD